MKRFIARATLVAVGIAGVIGVAGAPVAAARPCIVGTVCVYNHTLTGDAARYVIVDNYSQPFCFNLPPEWDNVVDSAQNLTSRDISLFGGNFCQTDGILLPNLIHPGESKRVFDGNEANSVLLR